MAHGAVTGRGRDDEFARLHGWFVEHLGMAVGFAWLASAYAALHAPWVNNIRGLINPLGRAESTLSYLFALPLLMTAGWVAVWYGADTMRRSQVLKSQTVEFALAALVAFAVFCMAVDRAVTAYLLG